MVSLCQAAAFSPTSRKYVLWASKQSGVPQRVRRCIAVLYSTSRTTIAVASITYHGFEMASGVKQGCPQQGHIRCRVRPYIVLDRSLAFPLSPALSAVCGDLCIVTSGVLQAWC